MLDLTLRQVHCAQVICQVNFNYNYLYQYVSSYQSVNIFRLDPTLLSLCREQVQSQRNAVII